MIDVIIIGASDTFELVEHAFSTEQMRVKGYIGDIPNVHSIYTKFNYLGSFEQIECNKNEDSYFLVAVYDNKLRENITNRLLSARRNILSICHHSAVVYPSSLLGAGSIVSAQAVISTHAIVGKGCYVNYSALVGHDVVLGDFSFISPGARILGSAILGKRTLIGSNAVVLSGIRIGDDVSVAAGVVVSKNVPSGTTIMPATVNRVIKK